MLWPGGGGGVVEESGAPSHVTGRVLQGRRPSGRHGRLSARLLKTYAAGFLPKTAHMVGSRHYRVRYYVIY